MNQQPFDLNALLAANHNWAVRWACDVLDRHFNTLIVNVHTLGEAGAGELVEIVIIDLNGNKRLSTVVKAAGLSFIPTNSILFNAPTFGQVYPKVRDLLRSATRIIAYDAAYHVQSLDITCQLHGLPFIDLENPVECAQNAFAWFNGHWIDRLGAFAGPELNNRLTTLQGAHVVLRMLHTMARDDPVPFVSITIKICRKCNTLALDNDQLCLICGNELSLENRDILLDEAKSNFERRRRLDHPRAQTPASLVGFLADRRAFSPDGHILGIFDHDSGTTVITGIMSVDKGDWLDIEGFWRSHPVYDLLFEVTQYQHHRPTTAQDFYTFLSSRLCKRPISLNEVRRLQSVLEDKITAVFVEDKIQLLDNLVSPVQANAIRESWFQYKQKLSASEKQSLHKKDQQRIRLFEDFEEVPLGELVAGTHRLDLTRQAMPVAALAETICRVHSFPRSEGNWSVRWDIWRTGNAWDGLIWIKPPDKGWFASDLALALDGLRYALKRDMSGLLQVKEQLIDLLGDVKLEELALLDAIAARPSQEEFGLMRGEERLRALSNLRVIAFKTSRWLGIGDFFGNILAESYSSYDKLRQEYLDFASQLSSALQNELHQHSELYATFLGMVRTAVVDQSISSNTLLDIVADGLGEVWSSWLRCLPFYPGLATYLDQHSRPPALIDNSLQHFDILTALRSCFADDETTWLAVEHEAIRERLINALRRDTMGDVEEDSYEDFMIEVEPGFYYDPIEDEYFDSNDDY